MAVLEFKSPASGGFIMLSDTFKRVCGVLQRPYSENGCLMPEDLDAAIASLEDEIRREQPLIKAQREQERINELKRKFPTFAEEDEEKRERERARERVSFTMRVFPLLEMMRAARKKKVKLWWGVP